MMFDKQTRQNKTKNLKKQVTRRIKEGAKPLVLLLYKNMFHAGKNTSYKS